MKNVVNVVFLSALMGLSVNALAGKGGDNPRMEPFNGDVATATEKQKQSMYYDLAVAKERAAKKAQETK